MPELTTITSESLQATIRRLLPSQRGFGLDLEATNVIQPIIDLTPTAEGSVLPEQLREAICFQSSTRFDVSNASSTITSTPGFYRVTGVSTNIANNLGATQCNFQVDQGGTNKVIWSHDVAAGGIDNEITVVPFDLYFFVDTNEALEAFTSAGCTLAGSFRQVASLDGTLSNPGGFEAQ